MAHIGHTSSQSDICIRCGGVCHFHGRDNPLDNAVMSFIRHKIPCTLLRAQHLSNAGFMAVDRNTLCCMHCGIIISASSVMMTPEADAFEDAVIHHILRNPLCQHAQGLLPICRDINQAF